MVIKTSPFVLKGLVAVDNSVRYSLRTELPLLVNGLGVVLEYAYCY
jgi:hypothetical protein